MPHQRAIITVRWVAGTLRNPRHRNNVGGAIASDADLLAAHVAGDTSAFEALFTRHRARLYRLALLTSGTIDDAEDALQEAMLAAHRTARSFRYDAAVSSWLYRIVVNACMDRKRSSANAVPVTLDDANFTVSDRTTHIDTALDIQHALMRLPIEQRKAVVAVDMLGYSVADSAGLFRVAEGTIKSRCARARARLAVLLGHLGPPMSQIPA